MFMPSNCVMAPVFPWKVDVMTLEELYVPAEPPTFEAAVVVSPG
jgi:hypothetical protein